jgi:NTE family protein
LTDIALALGGGGFRGIAHIGAIEQLKKEGYVIKAIAGSSAGGIVGALYAAHIPANEISKALEEMESKNLFTRNPGDGPALMGLKGFSEVLTRIIGDRQFKDLDIPFAVTAVDIISKKEFILNKGSVVQAILATAAIPGIFPPVKIGHTQLVDGGTLDPVPVAVTRWLAPKLPVVAICLSPAPEKWSELPEFKPPTDTPFPHAIIDQLFKLRIGQSIRIFMDAIDITERMITELRLRDEKPDVILRPEVHQFGPLERVDSQIMVSAGRQSVIDNRSKLQSATAWYYQFARRFHDGEKPPGRVLDADENNKN